MVQLNGVSLSYRGAKGKERTSAVFDINARFEEGLFHAIIGPSGCGKTSLLRIIAALIRPTEGTVSVGSTELTGIREGTAVIFQDYGLLPWKTVRANAELPLRLKGRLSAKSEGRQKVDALLAEFGLTSFAGHYPSQLSGGMKQRLAIVRALAASPELLLMDEPFSSLDSLTREDAQDFLLEMQRERRLTIIMITHSIEEAVYLADAVHVMNGINPGRIIERVNIERGENSPHADFRGQPRFQEYCTALRQMCRRQACRRQNCRLEGQGAL